MTKISLPDAIAAHTAKANGLAASSKGFAASAPTSEGERRARES